jgi:Tol biopolymer transport system component
VSARAGWAKSTSPCTSARGARSRSSFCPRDTWATCSACGASSRRRAQFHLAVIPEEGARLRVFDTPTSPIKTLRWTPDGSAILYIASQRGVTNVWKQPLDGGPAVQLTSFTSDYVLNFDVARDGRLLLARGGSTSSVVMLGGWR